MVREHFRHDLRETDPVDVLGNGGKDYPGDQVVVAGLTVPHPWVDSVVAGRLDDVREGPGVRVNAEVGELAAVAEQLPEGYRVTAVLAEGRQVPARRVVEAELAGIGCARQAAGGKGLDGAVEPVDVGCGGRAVRAAAADREVGDDVSGPPYPHLAADAAAFADPAL